MINRRTLLKSATLGTGGPVAFPFHRLADLSPVDLASGK
jgi:hypothetical protein